MDTALQRHAAECGTGPLHADSQARPGPADMLLYTARTTLMQIPCTKQAFSKHFPAQLPHSSYLESFLDGPRAC